MTKFFGLSLAVFITLNAPMTTQQPFSRYHKIEAYEVRPGILMIPRYTAGNEVCEIGLERLHYSPTLIRVDSGLSRTEINQTLDELVPADERGKPAKELDTLIAQGGQSLTTNIEFENISIQIYGATFPSEKGKTTVNEVIARVKWKQRICR